MNIVYSPKFASQYKKLPKNIRDKAKKQEKLFRADPFSSKLKTHKLTGKLRSYWAFSIDRKYRIVCEFRKKDEVWFLAAGSHDVYKK